MDIARHPWTQLRALRDAAGMDQRQLAVHLDVDQAQVSRWETGTNRPSIDTYRKLRRLLPQLQMPPIPNDDSPAAEGPAA